MKELTGRDLVKVFPDGTRALDGVSFRARTSRVLTLLGPSGCGKSTLLRIVAGLEAPTSGSLEMDGRNLLDVPAGERGVGFVFQNYALYPHLTVAGNLGLALEARGVSKAERDARVRETAALLGIERLLDRRPSRLSGGQQQRVALGRALVKRPELYLLDEPLSNLDALLRESTRGELKALFRRLEATVLYVTHDQAEAMSLSDEVAVLRAGRVVQCAEPDELYARPANLYVATFVGSPRMTVWRGRKEGSQFLAGDLRMPVAPDRGGPGEMYAAIRPEDVEVSREAPARGWPAEVVVSEPLGSRTLLTLRLGDETTRALVPPGDWSGRVWVHWPPERVHFFDGKTEARIEPPWRDGRSPPSTSSDSRS